MSAKLLLLLFALPLPQGKDAPLAKGLVRAVEVANPAPVFAQYFRLDAAEVREGRPPLGLARYVAGADPEGGIHVELELELHDSGVRLIHVEQESALRRRIVYRELGPHGGRTLFLEGAPGGPLAGYELGGPESVRRETEEGGSLPLLLLEALRRGEEAPSEARVLEPLAAAFEPLLLATVEEENGFQSTARRPDGSLRWSMTHACGELDQLRFQERGPVARPIAPEEYENWRRRHEEAAHSAREAAAERARPWDELVRQTVRAGR